MKHIVSAPRSRTARRLLAGGALMGLLLAAGAVAIGDVSPEAKRDGARNSRQSLSLFSTPIITLRTNQIECGIDNRGNVCSNVFNSPTAAGGAWPVGSPNAYIYNTGLQIAGIMGEDAGPWANDTVGAYFMEQLREFQGRHEVIGEVRGKGLMIGIELVTDRSSKEPARKLCDAVLHRAFHNGLILLSCGVSTVRFMPPLMITKDDVDEALKILETSIDEALERWNVKTLER